VGALCVNVMNEGWRASACAYIGRLDQPAARMAQKDYTVRATTNGAASCYLPEKLTPPLLFAVQQP
jgi:hypothetical protein